MNKYKIEKEPHSKVSNRHWFTVTDLQTGMKYRHYAEEFVRGTVHYDPFTDKYPNYVHDFIWRKV